MGIEFNLTRVFAETLMGVKTELNEVLEDISRKLRVEDWRSDQTFAAGWADGALGIEFYKGPDQVVHLIGYADKGAPALPETMFTLPAGYRPSRTLKFWIGSQEIEVGTDGTVKLNSDPAYASPPGANVTGIHFLGEL